MTEHGSATTAQGTVVDVGIPTTGKVPRYLVEAVESVFAQSLQSWRLVISENGPGLPSVRRALEPYLDDPRVEHVVTGTLLPAGDNATSLIRRGNAPYHGLLHDDDHWGPTFLERRVEFLERHPECGFAYSGTVMIDGDGHPRGRTPIELAPGVQRSADLFPRLYRRYFIRVPSVLVRRSAYEAVGARYKNLLYFDNEMIVRLSAHFDAGCLEVWDNDYRQHPAQTSADRSRFGDNHLELLDALSDLPVSRPLARVARAEAELRAALDAVERSERRDAVRHLGAALRQEPIACVVLPGLAVRTLGVLGGLVGGRPVRNALAAAREYRWFMGGPAGLLDLRKQRRLIRRV